MKVDDKTKMLNDLNKVSKTITKAYNDIEKAENRLLNIVKTVETKYNIKNLNRDLDNISNSDAATKLKIVTIKNVLQML